MKKLLYIVLAAALIAGIAPDARAQWTADTKISVTDTNAALSENADLCLAVSADSVHAVWWDTKKDSGAIYYRHSYDGGITWGVPMRITPYSKSVDFPSVAVSGSMVHVAWRNNADSGSYYIHSTDGGNTWGNPLSLGFYYFWPSITASGSNVFMTFNSSVAGNSEVYFRRSTDNGATWNPVYQISNAPGRSEDQSISTSGSYVHLVWNDNRTGIMQAWYRRSPDNGITWGPETQLSNALKFSYFPVVNANGRYVDVARGDRDANNNFHIMYTHSNDSGTTWTPEIELSNNALNSAYPVIKRDGQNVHIVWFDFNGDINYRRSLDGGVTWDPIQSLVSYANKPAKPFIAISGPVLHVIWLDTREGHPEVYYKRNPTGNPAAPSSHFAAPGSIDFGNLKVATSKDSVIILRNLGSVKITILKYSLFDPSNGFIVVDTSLHSIAPNNTIGITIRFNPFAVQSYSGILNIVTDESASSSYQIILSGKGIDGKFSAPAAIDFGDVRVGGMKDTVIILQNTGAGTMNITGYYLTDPNNGFAFLDTSMHSIVANGNGQLKIRFNSLKEQSYGSTITITTDESGLATHRIQLMARGVNSDIMLGETEMDFGNVDTGSTLQKTFTIKNMGTLTATVDSFEIRGGTMYTITPTQYPLTIIPGGQNSITISFNPRQVGPAQADLWMKTPGSGWALGIHLTGIGIAKKDTVQQSVYLTKTAITPLEVTPNPASGKAMLELGATKTLENVKIYFYNSAGQLLSTQNIGGLSEGMQSISLALPQISGIVFLRITSGGELIGMTKILIIGQ